MTTKVKTKSNNRQMLLDILEEQGKYRVVSKPLGRFTPTNLPMWFYKVMIISVPLCIIFVVSFLVSLFK